MKNKTYILILIAISSLAGACALINGNNAYADAGDSHNSRHQDNHAHHLHSMKTDHIIVSLDLQPSNIQAGSLATLIFSLKDKKGKPQQDITISHDRILHVVIVSEDFSVFGHIHPEDFGDVTPEMKQSAQFPLRYNFPKAGRYLVAVDYAVNNMPSSKIFSLNVTGNPQMAPMIKDFSPKKIFEGYDVSFTSVPEHITAGEKTTLGYLIKAHGRPITDLEPYLSAPMHLAIVLSDLSNFMHAHGEVPGSSSEHQPISHIHGAYANTFGPKIEAHVVFPVKGSYYIFSEIKHHDKVIVLSFMVEVE